MTQAAKTPIWKSIAQALTADLAAERYRPGDKLPSEAALAARFGVNRHTLRRAIADLAERGHLHSRRGSGVFVTQGPTDYPIGRRVRFHQNLRAAGRLPQRQTLSQQTRAADAREAEALEIPKGTLVHVNEGLTLADTQPMAIYRSVFPADRFPGLLDILAELHSVTQSLARFGISDYTRSTTRLTAKRATATQALQLRCREGDPVLRTVSVNVDADNRPVEYGHTWFAGDRVTLTLSDANVPQIT